VNVPVERTRRLRKGKQFDSVYREGSVLNGPLFVVRHRPNGGGPPRWGFAVGKRLSKSAVERNRVRRRLREASRSFQAGEGNDFIVTAKAAALTAPFPRLREALEARLRRAGLLDEDVERGRRP
jgi:ribonuclease P protein component